MAKAAAMGCCVRYSVADCMGALGFLLRSLSFSLSLCTTSCGLLSLSFFSFLFFFSVCVCVSCELGILFAGKLKRWSMRRLAVNLTPRVLYCV